MMNELGLLIISSDYLQLIKQQILYNVVGYIVVKNGIRGVGNIKSCSFFICVTISVTRLGYFERSR